MAEQGTSYGIGRFANASGIDRSVIDSELRGKYQGDAHAKEVIRMHVAERMGVPLDQLTYQGAVNAHFGTERAGSFALGDETLAAILPWREDDERTPQELFEILQKQASVEFDADDYDKFANKTDEEKFEEARQGMMPDSDITYEETSDTARKRLIGMYESKLKGKSEKRILKFIKDNITDDARRVAMQSLTNNAPDVVGMAGLSSDEREMAKTYAALINPEKSLDIFGAATRRLKSIPEDLLPAVEQAFSDPGYKRMHGRYVAQAFNAIDKDWRKNWLKRDGSWKSDAIRDNAIRNLARIRADDAESDMIGNIRDGSVADRYSAMLEDTKGKADELLGLARQGAEERKLQNDISQMGSFARKKHTSKTVENVEAVVDVMTDMGVRIGLTAINPTLGLLYSGTLAQGNLQKRLQDEFDFSESSARAISISAAVPYAMIERLQVAGIKDTAVSSFKYAFSKAYREALGKSFKQVAKEAGKSYTTSTIGEIGEEWVQKGIEIAAIEALENVEKSGNVDHADLVREYKDEMVAAATTMPFVKAGSGAIGAAAGTAAKGFNPGIIGQEWAAEARMSRLDDELGGDINFLDQWNMLDNGEKRAYFQADNAIERQAVLAEAGMFNAEVMDKALQGDEEFQEEVRRTVAGREIVREHEEFLRKDVAKFQEMQKLMTDAGLDVDVVDLLTKATDPDQVASIDNGVVELFSSLEDKGAALTHEGYHAVRDAGLITDKDHAVILRNIDKPEYAEIRERYDSVEGPQKYEDIAGDIVGITDTDGNVIIRVWDKIKDFLGIVSNERDVARKLKRTLAGHKFDIDQEAQAARRAEGEAFRAGLEAAPEVDVEAPAVEAEAAPDVDVSAETQQFVQGIVDRANAELEASLEADRLTREQAERKAERLANEAFKKESDSIESALTNFDTAVGNTNAIKDRFWLKMNDETFNALADAIGANSLADVRKHIKTLKQSAREWDKMPAAEKNEMVNKAREEGVQFARRKLTDKQKQQRAALQYASAKLGNEATAADTLAKIAERTGIDAAAIERQAGTILDEMIGRAGEGLDKTEQQIALMTAAKRAAVREEIRELATLGPRAEDAGPVQRRATGIAKAEREERKAKALMKASGLSVKDLKRAGVKDVAELIKADTDKAIDTIVEKASEGFKEGSPEQQANVIRSLSKALKHSARTLMSNKTEKSKAKASALAAAEKLATRKRVDGAIEKAKEIAEAIKANLIEGDVDTKAGELKKVLRKYKDAPKEGKLQRTTAGEVADVMHRVKKLWEMSDSDYGKFVKAAVAKVKAANDAEDDAEKQAAIDELSRDLRAIQLIDGVKHQKTLSSLDQTLASIDAFVTEGQAKYDKQREKVEKKRGKLRKKMLKDLTGRKEKVGPIDEGKGIGGLGLMSPQDALRYMFEDKDISQELRDEIDVSVNRGVADAIKMEDKANDAAKSLLNRSWESVNKNWSKKQDKYSKYSAHGNPLSKNNLMAIIKRVEREDFQVLHKNNEKFQARAEMLEAMKAEFTKDELAFADKIQEITQEYYEGLANKYEKDTGLKLKAVDGYVPGKWDAQAPGFDASVNAVSDMPHFLIPAIKHKLDIDETDSYIAMMKEHMAEMSMYKHASDTQHDISRTILSRPVKEKMRDVFGKKVVDNLSVKMEEAITNKSKVTKHDDSLTAKAANAATFGTAVTSLFGRVPSSLRQLGDFGAVMHEYNMEEFTEAVKTMFSEGSLDRMKEFAKHPLVRNRLLRGYDMRAANVMDKMSEVGSDKLRKFVKAGMLVPGIGDAIPFTALGAQLVQMEMKKSQLAAMKNQDEAYEIAVAKVVGKLERVYQSDKKKDMSDEFRDAQGIKKMFLQFLSSEAPKLSREIADFKRMRELKTPEAKKDFYKTFAKNHIMLQIPQLLVSFLAQNVFGEDEFDKDELAEAAISMIMGPFRSVWVFSALATVASRGFGLTKGQASFETAAQRQAATAARAVSYLLQEGSDVELDEMIDKFARIMGTYRDITSAKEAIKEM